MVTEEDGSVKLGLKDLYMAQQDGTREVTLAITQLKEEIVKISGHIDIINNRNTVTDAMHADFENRIRALEHWRYALPTTMLVSATSIIISIVEWISRTH